jgi:sterol desaturase/sphingolipid hydroxylase (fatty acid hydroxylase superfamily)
MNIVLELLFTPKLFPMRSDYTILYHAIPVIVLLIAVEMIEKIKDGQFKFYKKSFIANLAMGSIAFVLSFIVKSAALLVYSWVYELRLFTIPSNVWWAWIICFFADDFSYYCFHWANHHIRFLWASHAVHHSAEFFSPSVALRLPWTANFTGTFLFWGWMPLIGLDPTMIIIMKFISALYQVWIHTEKIGKLPKWVEAIFNTPSHHRVHHASNMDYLDKNHGGTLIIWDRIFGTFQKETVKPKYGLTKNITSQNPFTIEFHEWKNMIKDFKRAKKISDYLHFFFDVPGWSNDGNMKTTKSIRASTEKNKESE